MATAQEIFNAKIRSMPPAERLRLAAIILDDLTQSPSPLDVSGTWSDEDTKDVTAFSLRSAAAAYPEQDDLV